MRDAFVFDELDSAIELKVYTKSPQKWLLVDRETGTIYEGNNLGSWNRLDPVVKGENKNV
jgi:hypothetical protein